MAGSGGFSGWLATTFDSLRTRDYRVLWIGTALSFIAFMMSMTAQNVVAFDIAGNNHAVGTVQFGQGVAMLTLAPFAGALADRLSKRLVLLLCQGVIGLAMLAVGVLLYTGTLTILFLACSSFVMGTMFAFLGPARQAYIGDLVQPHQRGNAVALTQVAMNSTRVVGPFLAGGLLAWGLVGSAGTYMVMAGIFVVVVATLAQLPPSAGRARGGPSMWADVVLGVRHVAGNPRLARLVTGFVLVVIAGFPYQTVLPGFAKEQLGIGTAGFGMLLGISAIGGLLVSLAVASLADSPRAPLLLTLSTAALGVTLVLTGLAPTFALAALTMFGVGAGSSGFQTLNNALVMRESEPAYYGRVMSLITLAWAGNGLIALPVGLYADLVGERLALVTMGVTVCVVAGLLALWATRTGAARDAAAQAASATLAAPLSRRSS